MVMVPNFWQLQWKSNSRHFLILLNAVIFAILSLSSFTRSSWEVALLFSAADCCWLLLLMLVVLVWTLSFWGLAIILVVKRMLNVSRLSQQSAGSAEQIKFQRNLEESSIDTAENISKLIRQLFLSNTSPVWSKSILNISKKMFF